jgi:hypothetical protein
VVVIIIGLPVVGKTSTKEDNLGALPIGAKRTGNLVFLRSA